MSVERIMLEIKVLLHLINHITFTGTFSFYLTPVSSTAPKSKHRTEGALQSGPALPLLVAYVT